MPITNQAFSKRPQFVLRLTISDPTISDTLYTYTYTAQMTAAGNTTRPFSSGLIWRMDVVTSPGGALVADKGTGTYSYDYRSPASLTGTTNIVVSNTFTINRPPSNGSDITYGLRFIANTSNTTELIGTATSTQTVTVARQAPPPPAAPSWTTTATTDTIRVGTTFSRTYTATGINATGAYSLASGSTLPGNLTLNSNTGQVSGTVAAGADASLTFRLNATGPGGTTLSPIYTLNRVQPLPVWSTTTLDQNAFVGSLFATTVTATGINSSNAYSLASGSLPAGVSLNATTGALTTGANPVSAGVSQNFTFTIRATGPGGSTDSATFTIRRRQPLPVWPFDPVFDTTNLRVGVFYNETAAAANATSYSVVGLPLRGLTFSSNSSGATISGTPTSTSSTTFTIRASNSDNAFQEKTFTFTPKPAFAEWIDQFLQTTTVKRNVQYNDEVSASNATSYALQSGSLPPGILLDNSTGEISGIPTQVGTYDFTIRARNSANESIFTGTLTINVTPAGSGKVWNGSAWADAEFKVWNGSNWVESSTKVWNGSVWADPTS